MVELARNPPVSTRSMFTWTGPGWKALLMSMGATPPVLAMESGSWPRRVPESAIERYLPVKQSDSRPVGEVSKMPPRQILVGPVVPLAVVTVRLMKLSTRTFPVPSGVEDKTAWIGAEPQLRSRGELL